MADSEAACHAALFFSAASSAFSQRGEILGVTVVAHVIVAEDRAAAERMLHETISQRNARQIHAFNDPQVIAGQGTVMLELLQQVSDLDVDAKAALQELRDVARSY